nr:peptidase [Escherichia coli]
MMIVLIGLCLLAQLSGCTKERIVYVPAPVVPLPANLTADCPYPDIPAPMTWGGSLLLNEKLLTALGECNKDKASIRKIEFSLQSKRLVR